MLAKSPVMDLGEAGWGCSDEVDQTQIAGSIKRRPSGHKTGGIVRPSPLKFNRKLLIFVKYLPVYLGVAVLVRVAASSSPHITALSSTL